MSVRRDRRRTKSPSPQAKPAAPPVPPAPRHSLRIAWLAMAALVVLGYAHILRQGFSNDDYLILRNVTLAPSGPGLLWGDLIAGWWRPWSRELHFLALHRAFGLNGGAFHAVNLLLWLAVLGGLLVLLRRLFDARVAALTVAGALTASAWGLYLAWASCAQDLWMLLFGIGFLLAQHAGRRGLAPLALALALLSKETGVLMLPAAAWMQWVRLGRAGLRLRDWAGPLLVVLAWVAVHPSLGGRWFFGSRSGFHPAPADPLSPAVFRFLLAPLNLERVPAPYEGWPRALLEGALWAVVLGGLAWTLLRAPRDAFSRAPFRRPAILLGLGWWAIAWSPLALTAVSWHSYYGWFGIVGAWLAATGALISHPRALVAVIAVLALLRPPAAHTLVPDWSTEGYQRVAAQRSDDIGLNLLRALPDPAPHSRIIVAGVPSGTGLLSGPRYSAAAQVWYQDTTIAMVGLTHYWRRAPRERQGNDHFFLIDSLLRVLPLANVDQPIPDSLRRDDVWSATEGKLGVMLAQAGDLALAEAVFTRLVATLPGDAMYAYNLGLVRETRGDTIGAREWYDRADSLVGAPPSGGRGFISRMEGGPP